MSCPNNLRKDTAPTEPTGTDAHPILSRRAVASYSTPCRNDLPLEHVEKNPPQLGAHVRIVNRTWAICVALVSLWLSGPGQAADFQGLGTIPGTWDRFVSLANDVSGDGRVVVGSATRVLESVDSFLLFEQAMRWEDGVMEGLGEGFFVNHSRSIAWGVSYDGSVVVGQVQTSFPTETEVLVYDNGVITSLPDIAGGTAFARANGVSADGSLIVGYGNSNIATRAITWTGGVATVVGTGSSLSQIRATSADGLTWAGIQDGNAVWNSGVPSLLATPMGAADAGRSYGISADGTTIVGEAAFDAGDEAVRWVSGVPESIGDLPGGFGHARALDASADGSIIVGFADDATGRHAFVWDASNGMRKLQTVLETELGLDLTGWTLTEASGISHDGLMIVGVGNSPTADSRAFIADLSTQVFVPSLSGGALFFLTLALCMIAVVLQRTIARPFPV